MEKLFIDRKLKYTWYFADTIYGQATAIRRTSLPERSVSPYLCSFVSQTCAG